MSDTTKIEWTDATWNPITGCTLVSPGCSNCYAATLAAGRLKNHPSRKGLARRNAAGVAKFTGEVRFNEEWLTQPLRWRKPRRIFVCAHGDLFHEGVPDEWIDRVFAVMALCPQHTFQVLTKRAERMREYLNGLSRPSRRFDIPLAGRRVGLTLREIKDLEIAISGDPGLPLPNIWIGVSAEDQPRADERIPILLDTPAAVRFVSCEPLVGPVDLLDITWPTYRPKFPETDDISDARSALHVVGGTRLDWVITGGESGPNARPMNPQWARSLRDQCQAAGVPYFFKQWGEFVGGGRMKGGWNGFHNGRVGPGADHDWGDGAVADRVGKKAAGALLDGREWREMPT